MRPNWKRIWFGMLLLVAGVMAPMFFISKAEDRAYLRQPHVIVVGLLIFAGLIGVSVLICRGFDRLRGAPPEPPGFEVVPPAERTDDNAARPSS
jgi:hypothetical protein